jgi:hypothetical protein
MAIGTIGAILGAAGNVASGVMSIINKRKQMQEQGAESARQQAYYDSKANEDPLSKASSQRLMSQYDRKAQEQMQKAQGVAAITGATPEYTLAVQKGVAEGRAELMGDIAANAEATQEKALEQSEKARQEAAQNRLKMLAEQNQSFANLAANAGNAANAMINAAQPKKVTSEIVSDDGAKASDNAAEVSSVEKASTGQATASSAGNVKASGTSNAKPITDTDREAQLEGKLYDYIMEE